MNSPSTCKLERSCYWLGIIWLVDKSHQIICTHAVCSCDQHPQYNDYFIFSLSLHVFAIVVHLYLYCNCKLHKVVSLFSIVSSFNRPDSYFYMDTNSLLWDVQLMCWTKDSLATELSSSHLADSISSATLTSITSLNESTTPRSATPEYGVHRVSRPLSGVSFRSDDLETIPSQEVCKLQD